VENDGKRWAAIVRPGLGSDIKVEWGALGAAATKGVVDAGELLGEKNRIDVPEAPSRSACTGTWPTR